MTTNDRGSYAEVNGLEMYYEIHGSDQGGVPLVLLHGGLTTIDISFGKVLPSLAKSRRVIAVEQQAHGHTADIARPLDFEQIADDTAALLRHLGIEDADVFGYSDGGNVALGISIRHPDLVRKLMVAGTNFNNDGLYPEFLEFLKHATPDDMGGLRDAYIRAAPKPDDWPTLVAKVTEQAVEFKGWRPEDIQSIEAPAMVMIGDADIVRPEHAVELFRLLSRSKLAILPDTDHVTFLERADWLLSMIGEFLDASMPENDAAEGGAQSSSDEPESDLPSELARPAQRALAGAGYSRLEQFTRVSEAEILRLHGMGPKALDQLRRALAARGKSFADGQGSEEG